MKYCSAALMFFVLAGKGSEKLVPAPTHTVPSISMSSWQYVQGRSHANDANM